MKVKANRRELMFAVGLAAAMLLAVSAAAGAQSAGHMYAMATLNGEPQWRALLFPVSVDGTILASTVVLYIDNRLDRSSKKLPHFLLWAGVLISVAANVMHDWHHFMAGKLISAIGPLALFGIFHLFKDFVRSMVGVIPEKAPKPAKKAKAQLVGDAVDPVELFVPELITAPVVRPARLGGALRGRKRPGRLAGRRRHRKPLQTPATPATAPVLSTASAALNGQSKPPAATARIPEGPPPAEKKKRRSIAHTSRAAATSDREATFQEAIRFYNAETAAGRKVTAERLGEHLNKSKAAGWRWLQKIEQEATA